MAEICLFDIYIKEKDISVNYYIFSSDKQPKSKIRFSFEIEKCDDGLHKICLYDEMYYRNNYMIPYYIIENAFNNIKKFLEE